MPVRPRGKVQAGGGQPCPNFAFRIYSTSLRRQWLLLGFACFATHSFSLLPCRPLQAAGVLVVAAAGWAEGLAGVVVADAMAGRANIEAAIAESSIVRDFMGITPFNKAILSGPRVPYASTRMEGALPPDEGFVMLDCRAAGLQSGLGAQARDRAAQVSIQSVRIVVQGMATGQRSYPNIAGLERGAQAVPFFPSIET